MSHDELIIALELDTAPAADPPAYAEEYQWKKPLPVIPPSPTALELDKWSLRRGVESLEGEILGPILRPQADPNEPPAIGPEEIEHVAADCLAAAFEPCPTLAENCANETQGRYFRQLLETEEYQALHTQTQLDAIASELAAGHIAQGLVALAEEQRQQPPPEPGAPPPTPGEQARQEIRQDMAALGAAARALQGAAEDVDDLQNARRGLGGDGGGDNKIPLDEMRERFKRIRENHQLRRIMQLAGRYRRLAQAKQRQKTRHGADDVVGVELGNDLGRLCPSELAALADPDLELDAMRRYLERALMQRDYRGVESKGKGPIVVVVDESGSMCGEPIAAAKAFALAMAWIARHQNRWIALIGFAGRPEGNYLLMPPGKWDQSALIEWLEHFYSGGTVCDVPLVELPNKWESLGVPQGDTDIILITDAIVDVPHDIERNFNTWKQAAKAKCYSLIIGKSDPGDIGRVSDRAWCLPDLSIENDAVQELMAI